MSRLLVLLMLVLVGCGSSGVTATRVTKDRPLGDEGGTVTVPSASQPARVTATQAFATCRKDGSCLTATVTVELADVTTANGSLRGRLAYVVTSRHVPCAAAGPVAARPPTTCALVAVVDATSGRVAYQFDYSEHDPHPQHTPFIAWCRRLAPWHGSSTSTVCARSSRCGWSATMPG